MGKADDLTKQYIRQNDRFADICNFYLFDGEQVIDSTELQEQDTTELEVILGDGKSASVQKLRDVLKKVVLKHDEMAVYMIVGIENQHDIHYAMIIKNMVYDALNYASQVEKIASGHKGAKDVKGAEFLSGFAKTDKLLPVVTITIYWNSGAWDGPRTLHELFEVDDERITRYVADYKLNLIVPDEIEDFSKFTTELKSILEFVGISNDKNELRAFCKNSFNAEISCEAANLLNECFDAHIEMDISKGGKVKMCKGLEDWANESRAEGRAEGRAEAFASLVIEGVFTKEEAASRVGMSLEEFEKFLSVAQV